MRRLVYSPYVQAFVNSDIGVVDVSQYIVGGSVDRKQNQVSSAQLTLRNPVVSSTSRLLFTEHAHTDGTIGPMLHPMDPIVIVMTRLQGYPVEVFTGYLDRAPYFQLYPGLCSLEASCTLKRLKYTQWDPSLPFITTFLAQFGWDPDGSSGIINYNAEAATVLAQAGKLKGQFSDGSLGALLFAVVNLIGQWDESIIFIEALPKAMQDIALRLYNQIQGEVQQGQQTLQTLLQGIIGTTGYGGGAPGAGGTNPSAGGGTVGSSLLNHNQQAFGSALSQATGLDPNVVAAWILSEEPASSAGAPNGANNWLNIGDTGSGNYGGAASVWSDPAGAGRFTSQWMSGESLPGYGVAVSGIQAIAKTAGQSPQIQISTIQNSGWAASHYPTLPAVYDEIVRAGGNQVTTTNPTSQHLTNTQAGLQQLGAGKVTQLTLGPTVGPNAASDGAITGVSGRSPGGRHGRATPNPGQLTRYAAIVQAANAVNDQHYPYVWGGGHAAAGTAGGSPAGYDCSGSVVAVLSAAGYWASGSPVPNDAAVITALLGQGVIAAGVDNGPNSVNLYDNPNNHIFMQIGGHFWGTSDGNGGGGAGWLSDSHPDASTPDFHPYHVVASTLSQPTTYALSINGSAVLPDGTNAAAVGQGSSSFAAGTAFSTFLNLPGVFDQNEAIALSQANKSFVADQPLFPFVEQLCQASMRNFMSMPNGNFFAFYPDYFGLFGRKWYWEIKDIEIIDARIDLSDDPLVTHVAVAGDTAQYHNAVDWIDLINSSGVFTIVDAFATGFINGPDSLLNPSPSEKKKMSSPASKQAALAFLQRYGARPYVEEVPMIRSPLFELFYAFQNFILLWSKQFQTTIQVTFMPELFPGGLVALPDHHIQLYVEEVTHTFDYTAGFTTTLNVSSPSRLDNQSRPNISHGLARPAVLKHSGSGNQANQAPKLHRTPGQSHYATNIT